METKNKQYWVKLDGHWYAFAERVMAIDFFLDQATDCIEARLEERVVLAEKENQKKNEKENKPY